MKLSEMFNQEYVIVMTEYGIMEIDVSYDEDEYRINEINPTTLVELEKDEDTLCVAEKIRELGAEESENEKVAVYEGTVETASGIENCTVYIPEFWQ